MNFFNAIKLQILALTLSTLGASQAFAVRPGDGVVDVSAGGSAAGVIVIDQGKAAAGGITGGDGPGFPITISRPGSYRLDSNLTVPDTNTSAIEITSKDVTINLNGFVISGPNVCGSAGVCNVNNGAGHGINATTEHVTVFGGAVRGMGGFGVRVGRNGHVERMHLNNNGGTAIVVGQDSLVSDCTADLNGGHGIWAGNGSLVLRSVFAYNLNGGFFHEIGLGAVAIGENVFRYNLVQPWVGSPVHLQPSACFGNLCP